MQIGEVRKEKWSGHMAAELFCDAQDGHRRLCYTTGRRDNEGKHRVKKEENKMMMCFPGKT